MLISKTVNGWKTVTAINSTFSPPTLCRLCGDQGCKWWYMKSIECRAVGCGGKTPSILRLHKSWANGKAPTETSVARQKQGGHIARDEAKNTAEQKVGSGRKSPSGLCSDTERANGKAPELQNCRVLFCCDETNPIPKEQVGSGRKVFSGRCSEPVGANRKGESSRGSWPQRRQAVLISDLARAMRGVYGDKNRTATRRKNSISALVTRPSDLCGHKTRTNGEVQRKRELLPSATTHSGVVAATQETSRQWPQDTTSCLCHDQAWTNGKAQHNIRNGRPSQTRAVRDDKTSNTKRSGGGDPKTPSGFCSNPARAKRRGSE